MILTVTVRAAAGGPPATDLGYLLHKHPDRVHTLEVAAGTAHVFYPHVSAAECTVALLLEVDPVGLVQRGLGTPEAFALGQYVNDRPYAASSLLAGAFGKAFRTAIAGRCTARPDLVDTEWDLRVRVPALPVRGAPDVAARVFAPLGWTVDARSVPLDATRPDWGDSRYVDLHLGGRLRLADALGHLYVLIPVLDDAKHYWVGPDEVDKLVRSAGGWLATHPERALITTRYLAHRRSLVLSAVGRLAEVDDTDADALDNAVPPDAGDEPDEKPVPLAVARRQAVVSLLREVGARRVLDLGCGEGALLRDLLADPAFAEVVGVEVSARALDVAAKRLRLDRLPERVRERLRLLQSSLTYVDARLAGYDAAVLVEVVEHVDPGRLPALERAVLGSARPRTVIVTTPNVEHNVRYPGLAAGGLRHPDHRFEWTREEFRAWATRAGDAHGYDVTFRPVGGDDPEVGPPTQLAAFALRKAS